MSAGTMSVPGFESPIVVLTPRFGDTLTPPICRLSHAELLHALAPTCVSINLPDTSPLISVRMVPFSLVMSEILMSVFGSE